MKNILKKCACVVMACTMLVSAVACGKKNEEEASTKEIVVYAATSLRETLTEAGKIYEEKNQDIKVVFKFGPSSELKDEILAGADCDVYISAAQTPMNQIDITCSDNVTGVNYVEHGSRRDFLANKVVLVVPAANEKKINGFEKVKTYLQNSDIKVAVGSSDTALGQYTQKIIKSFGMSDETLKSSGLLVYADDVETLTADVKDGKTDCGIVYSTDAKRAKLTIVGEASGSMCGGFITYPAAVMEKSHDLENAEKFLDFLSTEEPMKVFKDAGFTAAS